MSERLTVSAGDVNSMAVVVAVCGFCAQLIDRFAGLRVWLATRNARRRITAA